MIDAKFEAVLDQWIEDDREKLMKDIFKVCSIKSVSTKGEGGYPFGTGCHDVLLTALDMSKNYGFRTKNVDNHCGYCVYGDNDGKTIGMFSHLDVVPEGDGWHNHPYEPIYKDGFLIGRGVSDNKGASMASLHALRFLNDHGIKLKHNVLLYFGCSEETGMEDIKYFTDHEPVPYFSLVPDTNFPVCYGEKGILRFSLKFRLPEDTNIQSFSAGLVINSIPAAAVCVLKHLNEETSAKLSAIDGIEVNGNTVTAEGVAAHAAFPESSRNAIHVLADAILVSGAAIESEEVLKTIECVTSCYDGRELGVKMEDKESGPLTAVGTIIGNDGLELTLKFDMRYPVTKKGTDIIAVLQDFADAHGAELTVQEDSTPAYTPLDSVEVQTLCKIAEYVHKRELTPYTMGGGTYSRMLPFAVGFGPGLPDSPNLYEDEPGRGHGHQPDECIVFDNLLKAMKAYVIALVKLDEIID